MAMPKAAAAISSRTVIHIVVPSRRSSTSTGVASAAWNVRRHLMPAITGQAPCMAAVCIAEAAIIPGARKAA